MTTDVATTNASLTNLTYEELVAMEGAEIAVGTDLLDKDELIGVPFAITGIFFRPSDQSEREYVSVEAITQDGSRVVFNDGGLGIRETLTKWAVDKGIVDADATENPDGPIVEFVSGNVPSYCDVRFDDEGNTTLSVYLPRPLICSRGLRKSSYKAKGEKGKAGYRPAGTTYYIA